jgi:Hemerythrin HHE cation binding domain
VYPCTGPIRHSGTPGLDVCSTPATGIFLVVTITDPRGDPSLLQTVVQAEHARLTQLVDEARRDTSGTPGVQEQLLHRLRTALAEHLNAESAVVHPEVRSSLGDNEAAALGRDTRDLHELLDQPVMDLDWLAAAVRAHIETFDALLAELRQSLGGKRMATLGFEYGRIAEAAPSRLAKDAADRT